MISTICPGNNSNTNPIDLESSDCMSTCSFMSYLPNLKANNLRASMSYIFYCQTVKESI